MATGTSLSHVVPAGQPPQRARAPGGRRVRHDRAGAGVRHARIRRRRGRSARPRARVRGRPGANAGHEDFHVVFASKAFPCTAVLALFAAEGLWCDVASGGELHLALQAGFPAERIVHARQRQVRGGAAHGAARTGSGLIVLDNFDEIERWLASPTASWRSRRRPAACSCASRPDVAATPTRRSPPARPTRSSASRWRRRARRSRGCGAWRAWRCEGLHAHIGSQLLDARAVPARGGRAREARGVAGSPSTISAAGSGVAYTEDQGPPPSIEEYVAHDRAAPRARRHRRGRAAAGRARPRAVRERGVTLYTVESVKQNVSRWVAVDGGMSDNMRPMLYGASYEAHVADRFGGGDASACSPASTASPAT